ncbi:MAG: hypothetical protein CMI55_00150 [Parcubacteria group bacterium]|jgi:hypothetical protein|nr:hypothetical protein [Parcubacteria group bacterium]|tara:strand:- start:7020 stop:7349 length:330 start_codon:yes stop_codon:yes gene_type:complete
MFPEKWENLINDIKDRFEVEDSGKEHSDEHGGIDTEFIIFKGPLGKIKLEFITKPVVLDKKTTYSQRVGSETNIEYIYSPDEKTHRLVAYKWDELDDGWVEMDADSFKK